MAADDDLIRMSADSISRVGLGRDFDFLHTPQSHVGDDIRLTLMGAFSRSLMPIWFWRIPLIGQYLDGLGFARAWMLRLVDNVVQGHEERIQNSGTQDRKNKSQTFLDKLYQLMESEKVHLPRERVNGNVLTLFLGGSDTTPKALIAAVYVLAKEQDLQKELQQEVADFDLEQASLSDLFEKLPRLKSFLHEIHRYYANPVLFFQTQEDIDFCGTTLPKYSDVLLLTRYLMKSEHSQVTEIPLAPDKEPVSVFCPTRYLVRDPVTGNVACKGPAPGSYGSAGFGVGTRHCPGRTYSEALSYCVLIKLLQKIDISLASGQREPKFIYEVLMVPDYPVQLAVTKRAAASQ